MQYQIGDTYMSNKIFAKPKKKALQFKPQAKDSIITIIPRLLVTIETGRETSTLNQLSTII